MTTRWVHNVEVPHDRITCCWCGTAMEDESTYPPEMQRHGGVCQIQCPECNQELLVKARVIRTYEVIGTVTEESP